MLVGERVEVETPHPRAQATGIAPRLDGKLLERVEAEGKNLYLHFEGGLVLRSHLRMSGRWYVEPRGRSRVGRPWLVLRGAEQEAVLWNGPVLELDRRLPRLGPDILTGDLDAAARNVARSELAIGEALLDQRLVAGIGNLWRAEALWHAQVSPWAPARSVDVPPILEHARRLMRQGLDGLRAPRVVYRTAGRPCPRCRTPIRSRGQGDDNRTAYWCPGCQAGPSPS